MAGRIAAIGPRELRRLIDEFNGLAADLSASEAQTQALEDQLARLQEEERAELSRNLHDEVGPLLFLAKIDLLAVSRHPAIQADDELAKSIAAAAGTLSSIQMSLREVLNRLRPYEGLELGLARALEMLLAQWGARFKDIRFELRIAGEPASMGERVQDSGFRIVQEAISNAVRHSQPSRVDVTLRIGRDKVEIGIANDGRVLAPADTNGLGLRTMRERAAGVGGVLIVERGEDRQGWHALASLPLFDMAESNPVAVA